MYKYNHDIMKKFKFAVYILFNGSEHQQFKTWFLTIFFHDSNQTHYEDTQKNQN